MNLKGRVVIVTGGNSGIGRATALVFAGEGARVVIGARNVERGRQVVVFWLSLKWRSDVLR